MADTMKKIETLLEEHKVNVEELPQRLQKAIENSKRHYADWEEANALLTDESSDEEKADVSELKEVVQDYNQSIMEGVENFIQSKKETPKPKEDGNDAPKPKEESTPHVAPKEEKKGNGVGWAIFGALALVVTLGAVNVMNKN